MLPSVVDRGVVLHLGFRFPKDVLEWEGLDAGNLSFPLQRGGRHRELCPGDGLAWEQPLVTSWLVLA